MHEPLILGIILPLATRSPFKIRRSKRFVEMERHMRGMWESREGVTGHILRDFFLYQT